MAKGAWSSIECGRSEEAGLTDRKKNDSHLCVITGNLLAQSVSLNSNMAKAVKLRRHFVYFSVELMKSVLKSAGELIK